MVSNVFLIKPHVLLENEALVAATAGTRKSVLGLARIWGPWLLLKLRRRLTLEGVAAHVEKVTGVKGAAVMFSRPEVAIDLDFAVDVGIVEAWFARKQT